MSIVSNHLVNELSIFKYTAENNCILSSIYGVTL